MNNLDFVIKSLFNKEESNVKKIIYKGMYWQINKMYYMEV